MFTSLFASRWVISLFSSILENQFQTNSRPEVDNNALVHSTKNNSQYGRTQIYFKTFHSRWIQPKIEFIYSNECRIPVLLTIQNKENDTRLSTVPEFRREAVVNRKKELCHAEL